MSVGCRERGGKERWMEDWCRDVGQELTSGRVHWQGGDFNEHSHMTDSVLFGLSIYLSILYVYLNVHVKIWHYDKAIFVYFHEWMKCNTQNVYYISSHSVIYFYFIYYHFVFVLIVKLPNICAKFFIINDHCFEYYMHKNLMKFHRVLYSIKCLFHCSLTKSGLTFKDTSEKL